MEDDEEGRVGVGRGKIGEEERRRMRMMEGLERR